MELIYPGVDLPLVLSIAQNRDTLPFYVLLQGSYSITAITQDRKRHLRRIDDPLHTEKKKIVVYLTS
jgi:hypothetical protein